MGLVIVKGYVVDPQSKPHVFGYSPLCGSDIQCRETAVPCNRIALLRKYRPNLVYGRMSSVGSPKYSSQFTERYSSFDLGMKAADIGILCSTVDGLQYRET